MSVVKKRAAVSPRQVEDAKQDAISALEALFEAHEVKWSDTPVCWSGRLARAYQKVGGADQPSEKMVQVIDQLEKKKYTLRSRAERMVQMYQRIYQNAYGEEPEPIKVEPCQCVYCEEERKHQAVYAAEQRLREAFFSMTMGDKDSDPMVLQLFDADDTKGAFKMLAELANAQAKYRDACRALDMCPAWEYVLNRTYSGVEYDSENS